MLGLDNRIAIEIPPGLSSDSIMRSLELGHGYVWQVIVKDPALVAYGSTKYGDMPELLLLAGRTLIVSDGNRTYANRIRSVLEMLQRQKRITLGMTGGASIG
ncbi:MAG: hypothetical protein EAX95_15805 [Candidatus Thorarchaeota archaeon]|nr:hypothetical protein [Candidatus Thorarchaeota archaeon]